jgi:hypothetical protein
MDRPQCLFVLRQLRARQSRYRPFERAGMDFKKVLQKPLVAVRTFTGHGLPHAPDAVAVAC